MNFDSKIRNTKCNFVNKFRIATFISCFIVISGIVVFCISGLNLSIDFTGGTIVNIKAGAVIEESSTYNAYIDRIETVISEYDLSIAYDQKEGEGTSAQIQIRYQDAAGKTVEEMTAITENVVTDLESEFAIEGYEITSGDRITASASSSLLTNALLAVVIATLLILGYLAFRFKLIYSVCAIVGILHDMLIVVSFMVIFNLEIGSVFIAALITILGYTLNNNVVIFDRIRENVKNTSTLDNSQVTNKSIKQSLVRTLTTSFTTLIALVAVALFGVSGITSFALPIIVGVVAGVYSSTFIVTPLFAKLTDKFNIDTKKIEKTKSNTDNEIIIE